MYKISTVIGDKADDLAANLNMLDTLKAIRIDASRHQNPMLHLLLEWDGRGGNRDELVSALNACGLHALSEQYVRHYL